MSKSLFKISGGYVYDPVNGIDGQVKDLWIDEGRIVEPPVDPQVRPARTLNATGLIVMPGGVDMHCHIAGPKVNVARKLRPEEKRRDPPVLRTARTHSGSMGSVPSTFATGYKYLGLGYTAAFDAAVPPLSARHAHEEFEDTPCIDKGFLCPDGEQSLRDEVHPGSGTGAAAGLCCMVAWRGQRLCRQTGQSGGSGSLEALRERECRRN